MSYLNDINYFKDSVSNYMLPICLGKDESNNNIWIDLVDETSLIISGDVSSGKTETAVTTLLSLLAHVSSNNLRVFMFNDNKDETIKYIAKFSNIHYYKDSNKGADLLYLLEQLNIELENRREILKQGNFETWKDLKNKYIEYDIDDQGVFPWLMLFINRREEFYYTDISKEENKKIYSLIEKLVKDGRYLGIKLYFISNSFQDNYIPKQVLNTSSLVISKKYNEFEMRLALGVYKEINKVSEGLFRSNQFNYIKIIKTFCVGYIEELKIVINWILTNKEKLNIEIPNSITTWNNIASNRNEILEELDKSDNYITKKFLTKLRDKYKHNY